MKQGINGKTVVVTGASSGVGRAAAIAFAREGAQLVLAARREQALAEVAEDCKALGAHAIYVVTDVTNSEEVRRLALLAFEFGGHIDVWINNAGVLAAGAFDQTPIEVHEQVVKTNLMGYMNGAHAVLPYFKKQGYGVIINNISVGGWTPTPFGVGYTASKFALRGYAESLRGELDQWPEIHICDLYPGFLDTPGIQHAANYTGKTLRPAPPIYDPQLVAEKMVAVTRSPRKEVLIGNVAHFLRVSHFLFPTLTSRIAGIVMKTYFKRAEPAANTAGNLFHPVEFGTSANGGWKLPLPERKKSSLIAVACLATLSVGLALLRKR